jgi:hypothetical protein
MMMAILTSLRDYSPSLAVRDLEVDEDSELEIRYILGL